MTETGDPETGAPPPVPPPPLGGPLAAEWALTEARVRELRADCQSFGCMCVVFGVVAPVGLLIYALPRLLGCGQVMSALAIALLAAAVLAVFGWPLLRYRRVVRGEVADGRVLLTTLSGDQLELRPEQIALARLGRMTGLRLCMHPLPAWRVLLLYCPPDAYDPLCEALWRLGVRVELRRW